MKKILIIFFIWSSISTLIYTQNFLKNTNISFGFSFTAIDKRIKQWPVPVIEGAIDRNKVKYDYEYTISLQKQFLNYKGLISSAGLGYAEYLTFFSRPFDHNALNGGGTQELRWIKLYHINKLTAPISLQYVFTKGNSFFIGFNTIPAFEFRKSAKDKAFEKKISKWQFRFNSFELYPLIGKKINDKISISVNYRLFYLNRIDEAIWAYWELLPNKYEQYNPLKLWFTMSYTFKK